MVWNGRLEGGQVVYQVNQGYVGASDQRRDGQACGV